MTFRQGDLVEPTQVVTASYSGYGGRPVMHFEPGMIGVVRHIDHQAGVQVEFFSPASGMMEAARTHAVQKVKWPGNIRPPECVLGQHDGWWFCGSLHWRGALLLLDAVAKLRPDYFLQLDVGTLRIPLMHSGHLRRYPGDPAKLSLRASPDAEEFSAQLQALIAASVRESALAA